MTARAASASSVATINQLLAQFETANNAVVKGTIAGADITDYLDLRDSILSLNSPGFWLTDTTDTHEKLAHFMRAADEVGDKIAIDFNPGKAVTEMIIYTPDHPGLFSRLAGAISISNGSIVGAKTVRLPATRANAFGTATFVTIPAGTFTAGKARWAATVACTGGGVGNYGFGVPLKVALLEFEGARG